MVQWNGVHSFIHLISNKATNILSRNVIVLQNLVLILCVLYPCIFNDVSNEAVTINLYYMWIYFYVSVCEYVPVWDPVCHIVLNYLQSIHSIVFIYCCVLVSFVVEVQMAFSLCEILILAFGIGRLLWFSNSWLGLSCLLLLCYVISMPLLQKPWDTNKWQ